MKIIDISIPTNRHMLSWPGSSPFQRERVAGIGKKYLHNESIIRMSVHAGTHLDAPLHFVRDGKPVEKMALENFIGRSFVADVHDATEITVKNLDNLQLPRNTTRILFKTANSKLWREKKFNPDYVGLTPDAARWLVKKRIKLVGSDYLSIAGFSHTLEVHRILLGAETAVLEGINLSKVEMGEYELICLPLNLSDSEAAPTRAVLLPTKEHLKRDDSKTK